MQRLAVEPITSSVLSVKFESRMTVQFGKEKSLSDLRWALKSSGCSVTDEAMCVLERESFRVTTTERVYEVTTPSLSDLDLPSGGYSQAICKNAQLRGLWCVPTDDFGPQLILQIPDLKEGEVLHIAPMKRSRNATGKRVFFKLTKKDGVRILDTCVGWSDTLFGVDDRFVFIFRPNIPETYR